MKNRQIWLCSRPNGIPQATDFAVRETDMPTISDGEFLVRNQFLSADPAMRGWIADTSTYWPRIEVGDTMRAFSVGDVIESRNPAYAVGDKVMGIFGWQDYAAVKQPQVMRNAAQLASPAGRRRFDSVSRSLDTMARSTTRPSRIWTPLLPGFAPTASMRSSTIRREPSTMLFFVA